MSIAETRLNNGEGLECGLRVLSNNPAADAYDTLDLRHCIVPLLEALNWSGRSHHISEAIPHFIEEMTVEHFCSTLANLGMKTFPLRTRLSELEADLLPCLFIPNKGHAQVVISREPDGFRVFDSATSTSNILDDVRIQGMAYIVRPVSANNKDNAYSDQPWLQQVSRRFHRIIKQIVLTTFLIHAMALSTPLFMMAVYDVVIPSGSIPQLISLGLGVILGITIEWMLRRSRARLMAHTAGRIDYLIGASSFSQVIGLPLQMIENEPIGMQISRLQEFESIREFFSGTMGETALDLPFALFMLAIIAFLSGWLALVPLTAMALLILIALVITPFVAEISSRASQQRAGQQQFLLEALSNMRALKFSGADAIWQDRLRDYSANAAASEVSVVLANNTLVSVGRTMTLAAGIFMIVFGSIMVMNNSLTVGTLIACITLCWVALSPFQGMLVLLSRGMQIRKSIGHINLLMKLNSERPIGTPPTNRVYSGRIALHGISYKHKTSSEPALTNVSISIHPGEVVAFTGANGGGKTTLISLIAGLYRPQSGNIFIDGIDIRQIDPRDIRQSIGLIPKTTELIYGTIAQNLRLAKPTATDREIHEAAEIAAIHETIVAMPDGYDTRLTEQRMGELSEGLKEKISFARALIRKPSILIFDEPSHMLDDAGERAFFTAITKLRGHCTILIVTEQHSHMRSADRVIVINGGRVQANGAYNEIFGSPEL